LDEGNLEKKSRTFLRIPGTDVYVITRIRHGLLKGRTDPGHPFGSEPHVPGGLRFSRRFMVFVAAFTVDAGKKRPG
jgi:hypothetical protein